MRTPASALAALIALACAPVWAEGDRPMPPEGRPPHELRPGPEGFPPQGPHQERGMPEMDPEQREELMDFLHENLPEAAERLERVKAEAPHEYRMAMRMALHQAMKLRHLKEHDPEAFEQALKETRLDLKAEDLVRRLRKLRSHKALGPEDQKALEELRGELAKVLQEQFEIRQARREREAKQLEQRLADLRKSLAQRRENREEIIERHLRQMTGEGEGDEW